MLPNIPIGSIVLPTYPISILLAFWVGSWLAARLAVRRQLDGDHVYNASIIGLLCGLIGGRFWYVLLNWDSYAPDVSQAFLLAYTAMAPVEGAVMAILGIVIYLQWHQLDSGRYADVAAVGLATAFAIGHFGTFLSGQIIGQPTVLPWAVTIGEVARHPTQLYEAFASLLILLPLLRLPTMWHGYHFWIFILFYGTARLLLAPAQYAPPTIGPGYLTVQVGSLGGMVVALAVMAYNFITLSHQDKIMRIPSLQTIIEQIALLLASLIWTVVILTVLALLWTYQDIQARQVMINQLPPEAQVALAANQPQPIPPTLTPSPTVWAGPAATTTPTPFQEPTPLPTKVVQEPVLLPETELSTDVDEPVAENETLNETLAETEVTAVEPTPTATTEVIVNTPTPVPPTLQPSLPKPTANASGVNPERVVIPAVGIDSSVVPVGWQLVEQGGKQYSIWQVADNAVGWHHTSAGLGEVGNTVMAGHHNVQGEVFRDLVNVEVGDTVQIEANGQQFDYQVTLKTIVKETGESLEVRKRNAEWIAPTSDERLTFVTCWPYTSNTHRVIVVAKPLS